jgi:hypothetical protein
MFMYMRVQECGICVHAELHRYVNTIIFLPVVTCYGLFSLYVNLESTVRSVL